MEQREEQLLLKRIEELANRSYQQNHYTFTDFLNPTVVSMFYQGIGRLGQIDVTAFGGLESSERVMLRFGSVETLGYEEDFPIKLIKIHPIAEKFAEDLSHRDFLGALMNLGIERDQLGDLFVKGKSAYVFSTEKMAQYIVDELTRVRHTNVMCTICESVPEELKPTLEAQTILTASLRLDGVTAAITKLSRSKTAVYMQEKKVMVNGVICENPSRVLKQGDVLAIRGYGKYILERVGGETKKGRIHVDFMKYV